MSLRPLLPVVALLFAIVAHAAPEPAPGYLLRHIDGENVVGRQFAMVARPSGGWTGFFFLEDEGRLVSANCPDTSCLGANKLTDPLSERGHFVSAAWRPTVNRPIAAFYDATLGALVAVDCVTGDCLYGSQRVLDDGGDVGQHTATIVDPATDLALISYYDVDNARLKLYQCATVACDAGSAMVVDPVANRGRGSRMAFAGSRLWIAYEDAATGEVRLAHADAPYTTFATFAVGVGSEPDVIATAGGMLEMVWHNAGDASLERMRCRDADCVDVQRATIAGAGQGHRPTATRLQSGQTLVSHFDPDDARLLGTLCDDEDCTLPTMFEFASGPALWGRAQPGEVAGSPLVFHYDGVSTAIRASRCNSAACTGLVKRIAFDGVPVGSVRVATRDNAPPVLAYIRQRQPWLALCSDALCTDVNRVPLPGGNSDERPGLALRPDQRPFAYFSSVGGSRAYDCADAACTQGQAREVTGSGNSTGTVIELALRDDGRPVLLYTVANQADVHLFLCDDVDCTSGTPRLLVDEAAGTYLDGFSVIVGPGDRPIAMYAANAPGGALQRYVRCDDSACTAASVHTLANRGSLSATPLALRSDGRPVFIDAGGPGLALGICDSADCTAVDRVPLPVAGSVRSLQVDATDRPVFEITAGPSARLVRCTDATCSDATVEILLTDADTSTSYTGYTALDGSGRPVVALEEQTQRDLMLVIPEPPRPDPIFRDGFEVQAGAAGGT